MGLKSKIETNTSTINDIVTKLNGKKLLVKTIDTEITSNGEYTPPSGYVGFSKVKVAVGAITGVTYNNGEITIDGSNATQLFNYDDIYLDVYNGKVIIDNEDIEVSVGVGGSISATNLTAENIKKDVNILGVVGTLAGGTTLKGVLDATKSCSYLFKGYNGTSADELIKYNDTSNVTNMGSMFESCSNLTSIPQLDTSKVTNMRYMFSSCSKLTSIPQLNTSNVTDMYYMFSSCSKLTSIPQLDTSNVTNMYAMFFGCSSLTSIPQLNTSNVTNMGSMVQYCSNLTEIHMYGMKVSFNISASTKFDRDNLVEILNNLATVTSNQTLTMGSTNLAKLTDEDKAIATNKGWTLA